MNFEQRDEIQAQVFPAEISADKQKSVANRLEKMSSAKILPVATDHLPSAVSRHASTNASNNSICIRAASSRTIPRGGFVSVRRGLPRRVALHRVSKQYVKRIYARRTKPWLWEGVGSLPDFVRRGGVSGFLEVFPGYARGHAIVPFFFFVDQFRPNDEVARDEKRESEIDEIWNVSWTVNAVWNAAF